PGVRAQPPLKTQSDLMDEPYESAARAALDPWRAEFAVTSDSGYQLTLERSGFRIQFATDRGYPIGVSSTLIAPTGEKYHFGMLVQILDPVRAQGELEALWAIGDAFRRDSAKLTPEQRDAAAYDMMFEVVRQGLSFFLDNEDRITNPANFKAAYD